VSMSNPEPLALADDQLADGNDGDLDHIEELSHEELVRMVRGSIEAGVRLTFAGKPQARRIARRVRPRVQRSMSTYSVGPADLQAKNLVIEGDNLQAMVTLYKERGRVDLIVADPPYNTGGDFRYNDKWDHDPNDPGLGEYVSPDEAARHTKWMKFMYPRLQMMKAMLKPSGVLAVCIDHRELFHLGQMLDELFGEKNRLAIINWQKSYSPRSDKSHVSTATEYVLVYAKDEELATTSLLPRADEMDARYGARDGDPRIWKSGDLSAGKAKTNQPMVYGIQSPFTGVVHYPPEGRCWATAKREIRRLLEQWGTPYEERLLDDADRRAKAAQVVEPNKILPGVKALMVKGDLKGARGRAEQILADGPWPAVYFGVSGEGRPAHKRYLEDVKKGSVPMTYWADDDHHFPTMLGSVSWEHAQSGHSQTGVDELSAIVGRDHGFKTVKPLRLIQKIIQLWCPPEGLVLDPFAGSGTTGHAVMSLNQVAGTDRRFILIEQGRPERGDSYARTLTADRLSRVVTGKWANDKGRSVPGGFRFVALTKKVDSDALLAMEREEMADTVIASYFDTSRKRGSGLISEEPGKYRYLVARNNDDEGFFLVWDGPGQNTDFDEDVYVACSEEAKSAGLKPIYHVYARFNLFQTDNVRFYQIPDRILTDFGIDLRTESFNEDGREDQDEVAE